MVEPLTSYDRDDLIKDLQARERALGNETPLQKAHRERDEAEGRHTALVRAIENWANEEHASVAGCEVYCADVAQRLSRLIKEHGGGGSGSEKCERCDGSGAITVRRMFGRRIQPEDRRCPTCHGSGTRAEGS